MSLRYAYFVALFSLPLFTVQVTAQEYYVDDAIASDPSGSIYGANMSLGIPGGYFWARGDFGERPGVEGNYFSTGAFAPAEIWGPNQVSFMDAQIFVNDQMGPGGDIGLGHRFIGMGLMEQPYAIGLNGFLTWDESLQGSRNRRGSIGVEFLTDWVHANANYYIPISETPDRIGALNRTKESLFVGNNLVFLNRQMAEQQMEGADFEVGVQVPHFEWLTLSGGGYYYDSQLGENVRGTTAKLGIDLTSAILDVTLQKDSMFGTTVNVGTEIRAGAGGIEIAPHFRNLDSKVYDRVRRRARIALQTVELVDQEIAINPATGMPFTVIHVDNTAAAGGDGSNAARFNRLDLANGPDGDIILVHRGTTSRANLLPGGNGLNLDNNQIVIGEGTPFLFQSANRSYACPLPGFDQMGDNPFVTSNPGTNVIDLANNNQVLGLNIIAPTNGNAIGGMNVSNFVINNINQNITVAQDTGAGGGVMLRNATGTGRITNTTFKSSTLTSAGGIVVQNLNQAPLNLTIDDAPLLSGGRYGIDLVATNSVINANINDVHANRNGTGIRMDARDNGRVNTLITSSNFDNALNGSPETGDGIVILGTNNGLVNTTMTSVTARNASRDAIRTTLDGSNATVNVNTAILTGAMDDTYDAQLRNSSSLNLTLTNTSGGMAGDAGMELDAGMNSSITATLNNANFSPVGGDGINSMLTNGSTTSITATNSSFANAGNDGLFVNSASGSTFNGSFTGGSFANASGDGIDVTFNNSLGNTLSLNGTNANNATGGDGFKFNLDSVSTFNASLTTVSFDNAMANAINGNVQNGSTAIINGSAVSGFMAGADGIRTRTNLNSALNLTLTNSGSFANAGGDGLDLGTTSNSTSNVNISGIGNAPVDFSGADGFGLVSFANNTGIAALNFGTGANFNMAGSDAIMLTSNNSSNTTLTGPRFSGMGAGGDGINLTANSGTITTNLTQMGDFSNVTGDAIQYAATNMGTLNMNFSGLPAGRADFTDAGARGVNGSLLNSTATLNLTDTNFNRAGSQGLLNVSNNSTFTANLTNSSFSAANGTALAFVQTNGAMDDINLNNIDGFSSATGHGLSVTTTTNSTADIDATGGLNLTQSALDGINMVSTTGSTITFDGSNVQTSNAGDDAGDLFADNARIDFTLTGTNNFNLSGDDGLLARGSNAAILNVNVVGTDFSDASGMGTGYGVRGILNASTATLNFTNSTMNNAGVDGLSIESDNSTITSVLNNITMNNAGGNAFNIASNNMSTVSVTGNVLSGSNAGNDGIRIVHDNSTTNVVLTNVGNFSGAGNNGVTANISNGTHPDFNLELSGVAGNRANFDTAGNDGVSVMLTNYVGYNALDPVFTFTEVNARNVGRNGFNLVSSGVSPGAPTTFNGLVTNSAFDFAGNHALGLNLSGNDPFSRMLFNTVTGTNATVDGANVFASNNTFLDLDILTPGGGGAGLAGAGDDIQDTTAIGFSTIDIFVN